MLETPKRGHRKKKQQPGMFRVDHANTRRHGTDCKCGEQRGDGDDRRASTQHRLVGERRDLVFLGEESLSHRVWVYVANPIGTVAALRDADKMVFDPGQQRRETEYHDQNRY